MRRSSRQAEKVLPGAEDGKRRAAELLVLAKWRSPPRESTSLRWRASRRSAAGRSVLCTFTCVPTSSLLCKDAAPVRKVAPRSPARLCGFQGRFEYLVKWRGWSSK